MLFITAMINQAAYFLRMQLFLSPIFLLLLAMPWGLQAQSGSLLLIGGGTERPGMEGWNGTAFQWAVNQSQNRRVIFVTFYESSASDWMPEHFISDWGADTARNFVINSPQVADAQATYDTLMQYDVIYIKGGDQANYYETYNNTRTEQAISDKFSEGGVICGTSAGLAILGEVDFTALNGTVYPDECLIDWNNSYVTLADDFLPGLFGGTLFDTHFVQRGRFGRLLAFMANWQFTNGQRLTGIGLDDLTAMAVDSNRVGTVYGTGCANIYSLYPDTDFQREDGRFSIDSIQVRQLLQGCTIDFSDDRIAGFQQEAIPVSAEETQPCHLILTGSDPVDHNQAMTEHLINQIGDPADTLIIFTGEDQSLAKDYRSAFYARGAEQVMIYTASQAADEDDLLGERIGMSRKFVFVGNSLNNLKDFLGGEGTGAILRQRIAHPQVVSVFIGDNSRLAGQTVPMGYLDPGANYHATMSFQKGLGLLGTSVVMPNTYMNSDIYENTAAGVPYAMIKNELAYGIWLARSSYAEYRVENQKLYLETFGEYPAMVLRNRGTAAGFSQQTSRGADSQIPRQVAGFSQMNLSVLRPGKPYMMGHVKEEDTSTPVRHVKEQINRPLLYQDDGRLVVLWEDKTFSLKLIDMTGKVRYRNKYIVNRYVMNPRQVDPALYIAWLREKRTGVQKQVKVLIHE